MARFILLSCEDNEEAERFVHEYQAFSDGGTITVVGLFGKPTNFCECPESYGLNARSKRGAKFGWNVCVTCNRAKFVPQTPNNLLPGEDPKWWNYSLSFRPSAYVKTIKEVWKKRS